MTRHAARPATAAALVALAFVAGCSAAPTGPATPSSSTRTVPPSLPREVAAMWEEHVDEPKGTVSDEELCGLLTAEEITEAVGVQAVDGVAGRVGCSWSIGGTTDAQGRPDAGLVFQAPKTPVWLGEPTVLDGHPARRGGNGDACVLKVLLRDPVEDPDDRPVLQAQLVVKGEHEELCPAAESLVRIALGRLPSA